MNDITANTNKNTPWLKGLLTQLSSLYRMRLIRAPIEWHNLQATPFAPESMQRRFAPERERDLTNLDPTVQTCCPVQLNLVPVLSPIAVIVVHSTRHGY